MSDKTTFPLSMTMPDDPKEVERIINILSQPHRCTMVMEEPPSVNEELFQALVRLTEWAQAVAGPWEIKFTGDHPIAVADAVIAKAKGLKP